MCPSSISAEVKDDETGALGNGDPKGAAYRPCVFPPSVCSYMPDFVSLTKTGTEQLPTP